MGDTPVCNGLGDFFQWEGLDSDTFGRIEVLALFEHCVQGQNCVTTVRL